MYCSVADIRSIIFNAHKIKKTHKCEQCNGTGFINWNGETGDDVRPGWNKEGVRDTGECEACDGIGYKDVFLYNDED